jgi:hypothetical protein
MCALPAHVWVMANKESAMFADMQLFYAMCFSIHTGCLLLERDIASFTNWVHMNVQKFLTSLYLSMLLR